MRYNCPSNSDASLDSASNGELLMMTRSREASGAVRFARTFTGKESA